MRTCIAAIAGLLISAGCASQTWAADASVTYKGVVDATSSPYGLPAPDYDVANLFGGGNLEGLGFTAVIDYDTTRGVENTDNSTYDELTGGLAFSASNPITSETYYINGYSYSFTPDYYADASTQSGPSGYIQDTGINTAGDNSIININVNAPASLGTSFKGAGLGSGYLLTAFNTNTNASDTINFVTTSVAVSAAPEPSTWVLMIAGVGLIGASLRYRRRPGVVALA